MRAIRYRALLHGWAFCPKERKPRNDVRTTVDPALVNALQEHNATLKADIEALRAMLAGAEARIEKQATDFAARDAQHAVELAAERARTGQAIAAFSALADRLDALAAERSRPWWRRRAG